MSGDGMLDTYREIERRVDGSELEAVFARWDCGDLMMAERNGKKRLPNNRLDEIAEAVGKSRAELGFRARFRELYPDRDQLPNLLGSLPSWFDIVRSFPPSERYAKNTAGAHEGAALSDTDAEGENWQLLLGDIQSRLADIAPGSVDAIITDPPYPAEYLLGWHALGEAAPRVLRDGGVLLARAGHLLIRDYLDALTSGGLQFGWIYSEPLPGSNVRFQGRKIAVTWQPWLALSSGSWPSGRIAWHPDTLTESPRAKTRYVWEQKWTVAAELTQEFTKPGDVVLDPFAGSGSYGIAALSVGCRWVGIERDPKGHRAAAERLGG